MFRLRLRTRSDTSEDGGVSEGDRLEAELAIMADSDGVVSVGALISKKICESTVEAEG